MGFLLVQMYMSLCVFCVLSLATSLFILPYWVLCLFFNIIIVIIIIKLIFSNERDKG